MRDESYEFLKRIVNTPSPSGYEQKAQAIFREYTGRFADEVHTDVLGNSYAVINPEGYPRVMLSGHVDEIGFVVHYISDEGFIYFSPVGGHDSIVPVGHRVHIHTRHGTVLGIIGRKAIHLLSDEERRKKPELSDLWIDIGATSKKEAEERVRLGDPITYVYDLQPLMGELVTARGLDNKMGCFVVAEALRLLSERRSELKAAVYAVSTVQEEVGLRGARTIAYEVDPQVAITVDVGHSIDYPGVDKKKHGEQAIAKGPVICRGSHINPLVFEMLVDTATEKEIPYQIEVAGGRTGTDNDAIQLSRSGVATGLVSVPIRYMHTPCELLHLGDLENTVRLLAEFTLKVHAEINWIPTA
ncbi:MAG: M42 family metallopeptidase [Armatimonadota bacterium]|nr:M42 family metallopeptidase [bacterium]MDW8322038.1 M42 family metallopeptidase [Armatimonadota bacterium]